MAKIYDISRLLNEKIAVWDGDTHFGLLPALSRAEGASVNLTSLQLSAHTGAHIDAPHHFTDDGVTVEALDLAVYWGVAQVVSLDVEAGEMGVTAFAGIDLSLAPRLLIHTFCSHLDPHPVPMPKSLSLAHN